MSTENQSDWTKVVSKRSTGRGSPNKGGNNNNNNNKKNNEGNSKKFTGHDKGVLEGIVLTENGSITQFTELHERLQTIGGSQYMPKVGVSIELLERLNRVSFAPTKPTARDWTQVELVKGKEVEIENEDLKDVLLDMYKEEVKETAKDFTTYTKDMAKVYSVALGQIDDGMKEKLKSNDKWEAISKSRCPVELLKLLRDICFQGNKAKIHTPTNLVRSLRKLLTHKQRNTDCMTYVQTITQFSEVVETIGGRYICPALVKYELETNDRYKDGDERMTYSDYLDLPQDNKTKQRIDHTAFQQFVAAIIIEGSDEETSTLKETLSNQYTLGVNHYPATTTQALEMLNHFKGTRKAKSKQNNSTGGNNNRGGGNRSKKSDDERTDHQENNNSNEVKEATTFVTKSEAQNSMTARQMLMMAVENNDDFGDEMDNFFQICVETNTQCNRADELPPSEQHDNVGYYTINSESESSTLHGEIEECNLKGRDSKPSEPENPPCDRYQVPRHGAPTSFTYSQKTERMFAQASRHGGRVNKNWILLDSESSCNLITNPELVTNIRKAPEGRSMTIHCNSGVAHTNQIADLPGYGEVWFYRDGIASVLSMAKVSDKYRITMDTEVDNAIHVHKRDGTTQRFRRSPCNLYYYDMSNGNETGTMLTILTVDGSKEQYSDLDVRRADKARQLQEAVGFPTSRDLMRMIDNKLLANTTVTRRDIQNAEMIYGKHSSIVKGKQVRSTAEHIREDITHVPSTVLDRYRDVTIHIDVMTVNGIRFVHSISRHIKFRTARAITNANTSTLLDCIKSLCGQYKTRGFIVTQVCGDNQFECLRDDLLQMAPPVQLHCVGAGQHDPTIERSIRTVKENVRCYFNHVPFRKLPKRCVIEMVYAAVFWLNCRTTGVCKSLSARELVTGIQLDSKECKYQFMQPILAHVDGTDNTMTPRAVDALYLRPTGSLTGGFWAYDINTGKRIHRMNATPTPLTQAMVKQIEAIADAQKCPSGILFGDGLGESTILDIDTMENQDDDDASDATYRADEDDDDDDSMGTIDPAAIEITGDDVADTIETPQDNTDATVTGYNNEEDTAGVPDIQEESTEGEDAGESVDDAPDPSDEHQQEAEQDSPISSRLRPTVQRTHNKYGMEDGYATNTHSRTLFSMGYRNTVNRLIKDQQAITLVTSAIEQYNNLEASPVTPQYGIKKGIKLFGEAGVNAVLKELKQIHDRKVLSVLDPKTMKKEVVEQALPYLMFLKRKRDTSIKGRGCADGRRQRDYIQKEDATSPTVSLYALILSCIIDAIEERDVATVDIPGAFLQTDMPEGEDVYIRLDGTMAELLCRVDPRMYSKYILNRQGKKTLFTRAEKAIYGTLRAALLFWEKLSGQLEEWGFELNPYDPCTANKIINGRQCTIVWHVDDLKISHKDEKVVTKIIEKLNEKFGVESPLTETRGKIHDYVGMTLDYSSQGKVKLSMFDYLEDVLRGLPEGLQGRRAVTPAADHLFKVNDEAEKLGEDQAVRFHHYVAKLLYASKRTRPDIQTAIAFLCTRVAAPDVDDWKKLKRVMGYLKETVFLPLVLGWDQTGNVYWHVDAAFAVHNDMKSHSGGVMTLGQGGAITTCTKQKLNTKSSTEAEIVGVDDNMNFIVWTRLFLLAQQQHMTDNAGDVDCASMKLVKNNILYQDNESAIKLERNGRASSTKRTRHINVRYFFITDKVKKGEVTIEYCPTDEIVADYFTKPLQGAKFKKFRNTIQGISEKDYLQYKQVYHDAQALRMKMNVQNDTAAAATA